MIERVHGIEACTFDVLGMYEQSPSRRCGRIAQWRIDGVTRCWQHGRELLAGRDDEVSAALALEGDLQDADRERRNAEGIVGLIYLIGVGANPVAVKVGYSRDRASLAVRVGEFQCAHWDEVRVLALHRGTVRQERDLHRRLRRHHLRGEWFRLHDDVWAALATLGEAVAA